MGNGKLRYCWIYARRETDVWRQYIGRWRYSNHVGTGKKTYFGKPISMKKPDLIDEAPQLFVDMDGVLADFDTGYKAAFGDFGGKEADDVDWSKVRNTTGFYASLPPMPDFEQLWDHVQHYNPIILTGVPSSVPEAVENKRAWVTKYIGAGQAMIGCKSAEKSLHSKRGDILIDDWEKYMHVWIAKGGRWITHVSATRSIELLEAHMQGHGI